MEAVSVYETFVSIQGESSHAGLPCFFIRLAGCNLNCAYCDTPGARENGTRRTVDSLLREAIATPTPLVEITGGEPLLQEGLRSLALALRDHSGKTVLVETNGSADLSAIPEGVMAIVDVKCPGSGEGNSFDMDNLDRLRHDDEVKFVISDRADYEWASQFVELHSLSGKCHAIHFSPAQPRMDSSVLAKWIIDDGLQVRLQIQLHRLLNMR